ncbi:MAG: hypothetical protein EBS01_14095, partial [Verrucomicrobia bacterium]|nr:hypothetical protein [Verrucomicrobiota bacterium]
IVNWRSRAIKNIVVNVKKYMQKDYHIVVIVKKILKIMNIIVANAQEYLKIMFCIVVLKTRDVGKYTKIFLNIVVLAIIS